MSYFLQNFNTLMKNKCLLLLLFASFPIFSWADETLDSLLHVLDQTILAHDTYVVQRESRIRHLKELSGFRLTTIPMSFR
jgi:hypothetical protein